jgi:uncharacterized protein (DUF169 family)
MGKKLEEIEERVHSYLGLCHRLVGVKISEENVDGDHPAAPMTFCRAVREMLGGKELVIGIDDLDCPNAELCLGFREPMFVDVGPRIKSKTRAVHIGPLEDADVVLFVLNSEQVMIMSILLGGIKAEFKGEMAICGEAVANVSKRVGVMPRGYWLPEAQLRGMLGELVDSYAPRSIERVWSMSLIVLGLFLILRRLI